MLFHVSEEADIQLFIPRPHASLPEPVVWAIDRAHLRNYLMPRDCPRVTFSAGPQTTPADRDRFLRGVRAVVAIERVWVERVRTARLSCYHLPPETFEILDVDAGYFVSRQAVVPARKEIIVDPLVRWQDDDVELRILQSLWPLHDAVATSTLEFSMIRMRLAQPRSSRDA